jgi:hypothetical protein
MSRHLTIHAVANGWIVLKGLGNPMHGWVEFTHVAKTPAELTELVRMWASEVKKAEA